MLALLASACSTSSRNRDGAQGAESGPSASGGGANSADRLVFWIGHREFAPLTDSQLDKWNQQGVDGFVSVIQWLDGLGGAQSFTGDPRATLEGGDYAYQRQLRDTRIVERARARDMKSYLGFYFANQLGGATPLKDWFDEDGWSQVVLPQVRGLAAAAKGLGFAGLAFDQELYPQQGNVQHASWTVGYRGNSHSEAQTRDKVKQRGKEIMSTILGVFPDVEIVAYATQLPESWEELVHDKANNIPHALESYVIVDLWNGLTNVPGYRAIRFVDNIFYKAPQLRGASWDTALQYNANRVYSLMSRRWDNWAYASTRVHVVPFSWIDPGTNSFEAARSPDAVAEQLLAFRKWAPGGEFANFAYAFNTFDYTPYAKGMIAASTPSVVDSAPPTLTVAAPRQIGDRVSLMGSSSDNLAIRAVRWQVGDGSSGSARMTWLVKGGSYTTEWDWEMTWEAESVPLKPGRNEILVTAEDIKGLTTTRTVSVTV